MRIRVAGTIPLIAVSDSLPLTDAAAASVVNRCGIRHGDERDPQRVRDLATLLDLSNAARRIPANGRDAADSFGQRSAVTTRGSCHMKLCEYTRSACERFFARGSYHWHIITPASLAKRPASVGILIKKATTFDGSRYWYLGFYFASAGGSQAHISDGSGFSDFCSA